MSVHRRQTSRGTRYDVRLRSPDGSHLKRTFTTKREAERFEARHVADVSRGDWFDARAAQRLFGEIAAEWLDRDPSKRATTLAREESALRGQILPTLGGRRLGSITPADVQALVNDWTARLAPRSVRRSYGVLSAILRYAMDYDYIARTPCRRIKLPEVTPVERRPVSPTELAQVAAELENQYAAMAYLGAMLGLRYGECAGLRVGRVDFLRGTLTVAEQLTRGRQGEIVFGAPKTQAGRRTLAMPAPLSAMLAQVLAQRPEPARDPSVLVFVAPGGGPLAYNNFMRRIWLPAVERAGLSWLRFHDLRRANATALVAAGIDLKTAQARLGHADPRMTLAVYAQATTEGDKRAAVALGAHFLPESDPAARAMDAP
jgi:integrase